MRFSRLVCDVKNPAGDGRQRSDFAKLPTWAKGTLLACQEVNYGGGVIGREYVAACIRGRVSDPEVCRILDKYSEPVNLDELPAGDAALLILAVCRVRDDYIVRVALERFKIAPLDLLQALSDSSWQNSPLFAPQQSVAAD